MNIFVKRNGKDYGPYSSQQVQQFLSSGKLFLHDLAREDTVPVNPGQLQFERLSSLLKKKNIPAFPGLSTNPFVRALQDLKSFDMSLLFPWSELKSFDWLKDRKLIYLALAGLFPMLSLSIVPDVASCYWLIALYFSGLWAIFFYYIFKTPQIENLLCFICFFFTGIVSITVLLMIQAIPPWAILYSLAKSTNIFYRFIGMFFGVGIHEELCKAAVLFWVARRPGNLLMPQSLVFYGMLSGLGFGIYEGVVYQMTINRGLQADDAYFFNIVRLTSLPFLHAIWTGIAAYFIAFSVLYPRKQIGLWILAIGIPALLHAIYNTFGWGLIGLVDALLGVIILKMYLSNSLRMQKHLSP